MKNLGALPASGLHGHTLQGEYWSVPEADFRLTMY
jgi:hypothetical protein